MIDQSGLKKQVADYVCTNFIKSDIVLGIGTGSTVNYLIDSLGQKSYRFLAVLSSSKGTTARLSRYGIECVSPDSVDQIDLYVDGADEVSSLFYLTKGGGGALTKEKILAYQAQQFVCMVDESKLVQVLGGFPIPVEVLPIARSFVARKIVELTKGQARVQWRQKVVTDNHGHILDVANLLVEKPLELETAINQIPGVISSGIFSHHRPDYVVCAFQDGVRAMTRS